jgi:hypothetical protein
VFVSRLVSLHSVVQVRANCISYSSCMSSCEWRVTFRLLDEMTTALIPPNDFIFNTVRILHSVLRFCCFIFIYSPLKVDGSESWVAPSMSKKNGG